MSAEPIDPGRLPWSPDPIRQRLADYTLDDVLAVPDDAPRVELVDGVMFVVPSPTYGHQSISFKLCAWLRANCPEELTASLTLGVAVDDLEAAVARVADHGGEVLMPPTDNGWVHKAIVVDPAGNRISLIARG